MASDLSASSFAFTVFVQGGASVKGLLEPDLIDSVTVWAASHVLMNSHAIVSPLNACCGFLPKAASHDPCLSCSTMTIGRVCLFLVPVFVTWPQPPAVKIAPRITTYVVRPTVFEPSLTPRPLRRAAPETGLTAAAARGRRRA